jgi:hypothetical protein
MNVKYETAMMKELDDPEASKLNWLDIATAFSVECGPARTTYLCIDPKTWEEKCAELVTKLEAERIEEEEFFTALEKLPMNILKNLRKFSRSANSWEPLRKSDSDLLEAIHRYWKGKRQMPDLSLLNDE